LQGAINTFCDRQRRMIPLMQTTLNSSMLDTDQIKLTQAGFDRYLFFGVGFSFVAFYVFLFLGMWRRLSQVRFSP